MVEDVCTEIGNLQTHGQRADTHLHGDLEANLADFLPFLQDEELVAMKSSDSRSHAS